MKMTDIASVQSLLTNGKVNSVELAQESLQKIKQHHQEGGKAWVSVDEAAVLAQAEAADAQRRAGYVASPLAGIPVSIKDSFDVKGEVSAAGSKLFAQHDAATEDAPAISALRAAGAVLVGRTNMSEFAFSGLGYNPHHGTPCHPQRSDYIAGGSTSGGAVSVAGGMVLAGLGSDTGGSLRIPAAFCDAVGFKPTAARVSRQGVVPLSHSFDSVGAITHSVRDCALVDGVLSGQAHDLQAAPLAGLRLFVTEDYVLDQLAPEVAAAFSHSVTKLSQLGATIVPFAFSELHRIPEINAAGGLTAAEVWSEHQDFFDAARAEYDPLVATRIERGRHISAGDYLRVQQQRAGLIELAQARLAYADAWLMPTVAIGAPKLTELADADTFFRLNALALRNTTVLNFLDGCAVSLPLGQGLGLSVGGLAGQDAKILNVALSIEQALIR
ncbi:MAG: hypothetical protein KBC57_04540 [Neisseriaceae bacterium]|nr:hypothetical protein [Neisseriaceae bacterium]